MKLEKVIEILELNLKEAGRKMPPDTATALSIAIKAVEFRQRWEQQEGELEFPLLPGETKD